MVRVSALRKPLKQWTERDWHTAFRRNTIKGLQKLGFSRSEIARRMGLRLSTIRSHLQSMAVEDKGARFPVDRLEERRSMAVELALKRVSQKQIARMLGVSHETIREDLRHARENLPRELLQALDSAKPIPFGERTLDRAYQLNALFDRRKRERALAEAGKAPKNRPKLDYWGLRELRASVSPKTAKHLFSGAPAKPLPTLSPEQERFRVQYVLPKMMYYLNAIARKRLLKRSFVREMAGVIESESVRVSPTLRVSPTPKNPLSGGLIYLYNTVDKNVVKQIDKAVREQTGFSKKERGILSKLLKLKQEGKEIAEMAEILGIPEIEAQSILRAYSQSKTLPMEFVKGEGRWKK